MSEQTSDYLAKRLQQNWMNRYPDKPSCQPQGTEHDDSLTNLNWLQDINLNNFAADVPLSPSPQFAPASPLSPSANQQLFHSVPAICTGSQLHVSLPSTYTSSQIPIQFSPLGTFARFREDCAQAKKPLGNRTPSGSPHPRSSTLGYTHRLTNNRISTLHRFGICSDTWGRSPIPTAHILRSSVTRSPLALSNPSTKAYTTEPSQPVAHFDTHATSLRTAVSTTITESVPQFYTTTIPSTTSLNFTTGNLSLSSYPRSDLITYPPPELLLVRTKSVMTDRTNYPTIVRSHGGPVYPSPFNHIEPSGLGTPMCAGSDLVDVSDSGLFVTLDNMDPVEREEYRMKSDLCPPYSFPNLIYMSMHSLKRHKVTLNDICTWIMENFAYFRTRTTTGWQEMLRENLTRSRCFQRVPRRKEEPGGKGDLWRLNPEFQTQLEHKKISQKFLTAWQATASYCSVECAHTTDVDLSSNVDVVSGLDGRTYQSPLRSSPKSLRRYPSSDDLVGDDEELFSCFGKRKRTGSYIKPSQYSDGSSLNDTASSCTSSSSPPLSDLYTPPPQFFSETEQFSPHLTTDSATSLISRPIPSVFEQSKQRSIDDVVTLCKFAQQPSPQGLSYPNEVHSAVYTTQSEQSMASDHDLSEMDAFFRTVMLDTSARLPDDETVTEFTQTCGLNNAAHSFDLPMTVDALDLTVRGVGLRPLHDWWSGNLSESMTELFDDSLELTTNSANSSPDKEDNRRDASVTQAASSSVTHRMITSDSTVTPITTTTDSVSSSLPSQELSTNTPVELASTTTFPQTMSSPNSPLSVGIEQQWIDEQLNLEELDSLLGLS